MPRTALIIGAGFSGLALAARLRRSRIDDFEILEQGDRLGGTWRDNSYPGAACDVESVLYSLSFAQEPGWTRRFAPAAQIQAYLERTARRLELESHVRTGTLVTRARRDERAGCWRVETTSGEVHEARVLVLATGGLHRPRLPDVEGLASFEGVVMHSARWRDDVALEGLRVGVVGTGASAIQLVPALATSARHLTVFQRTPAWILPRGDRPVPGWVRGLYRAVPAVQRAVRGAVYLSRELAITAFRSDNVLRRWATRRALSHLEAQVEDPHLRARLTPSYTLGCKRVLLSDDFYPALGRPSVELVSEPIARVLPRGVETASGRVHELDALVLCTGFLAVEGIPPFPIHGNQGRDFSQEWKAAPAMYLGMAMPGFPDLFTMMGPHTALGHTSVLVMIEAQARYIAQAIRALADAPGTSMEVRGELVRRFAAWLDRRLEGTTWASGCRSWYLDPATGRNLAMWPESTLSYRWRTRRWRREDYEVRLTPRP